MNAKTIKLNELSEVTQMNINKLAAILDELKDNLEDDIDAINNHFLYMSQDADEQDNGYADSPEGIKYQEWIDQLDEAHDQVREMIDAVSDWGPVLEVEAEDDVN